MRVKFSMLSVVILVFTISVSAQVSGPQGKERFVVVPREIGLMTVAYQPDCPLQFENVKLLAGVDGGSLRNYELRNRGIKPIRAITVGDSTGNRWTWDVVKDQGPVMPGQLVPEWSKNDWVEIVPLTNDLREKLKLTGPMRGLTVLIVIRVEFMDGTVYDDEATYKAMVAYMDDLQTKLTLLESLKKKSK